MMALREPNRSLKHAPSRAQLCSLVLPVLVWAVHFIAVFAGISAACAPRALLTHDLVLLGTVALTLLGLVLALAPFLRSVGGSPALRRSARWAAIFATAAIMFTAAPVLFFNSCGG